MCARHSLRLNGVLIHQVLEQELPVIDFRTFFPALTDEVFKANRSSLEPHFLDPATGKIVLRIQSYVLQTPHHNILIDTCIGNHKPRPRRPFWNLLNSPNYEKNLASIGMSPGDIDFVMCTISTLTMSAGTPDWKTADGCRPFQRLPTSCPSASSSIGLPARARHLPMDW